MAPRILCFPIQPGEERGFCTRFRPVPGSVQIPADEVRKWLLDLASSAFGPGLESRLNNLGTPARLYAYEPVEASLRLLWKRRIPGEQSHFAHLAVLVRSSGKTVMSGSYTIIIPP